jgi:hypothetical protein
MTITTASGRRQVPARSWLARVPLAAWSALAVALFGALIFWFDPTRLTDSLGDTDDATRMLQVRGLLAGASWFDMTLPGFGGPNPLVSHWSRLVDAPIAILLSGFEVFLPPDAAELAVRAVWPLLVLFVFVYLLAREVLIREGRPAALIAVVLTVTCLFGTAQFQPGRIDHHNVIILCSVIGILRLARSFDDPDAGWSAGVLLGLAIAIGYEALALITAALAAAVLYGLVPGRSLLGPSRAAVTFAATLTTALAITTAPNALFVSHCDALSINVVALAVVGATGVTFVEACGNRLSTSAKLAALGLTGAVALALFGIINPACLAGPFGEVDPAAYPIWLDKVSETQSLFSTTARVPLAGGLTLAYFAAGLYAGRKIIQTERGGAVRFLLIVMVVAIPLSMWQMKLLPYATYLPIPLLAIHLARPPEQARAALSKRSLLLIGLAFLLVIWATSWALLKLSAPALNRENEKAKPAENCLSTAAILPLAQLPKGLVVTETDLGPFIVSLTNLDVLAAPYHRLGSSIVEADRILRGPASEAEARLHAIGARYVITCKVFDSETARKNVPADALQSLIYADNPPAFLKPVTLPAPSPLKVWRVAP